MSRNKRENLDGFGAHLLPTHRKKEATNWNWKINNLKV
jgi:hypothetical protein